MIRNEEQIKFFKEIAKTQYLSMAIQQFGENCKSTVLSLSNTITDIYKYLPYNDFEQVTIFVNIESGKLLRNSYQDKVNTISAINSFGILEGTSIIVEVDENGSYDIVLDEKIDIDSIRQEALVYVYTRADDKELIFAKSESTTLIPIPGADTYFSIQTFKTLDYALEQYAIKRALYSECAYLTKAWFDGNRIFFRPKPESLLRDSLTDFLKITLRAEVRPEQNMNESNPVDIKITWPFINKLAIIEVKWLGKSLEQYGQEFSSKYTDFRARQGAKQLNDYLDSNQVQIPEKKTMGYLVIFDARRHSTNNTTKEINKENGDYYRNKEIDFNPQFHQLRDDFAEPRRFFMEPKFALNGQ